MFATTKELERFNQKINRCLQTENRTNEYAALFSSNSGEKISVVGEYVPLNGEGRFVGLDAEGNAIERRDVENFVYGISPRLSERVIISAISSLALSSYEGLMSFVREHHGAFMLHAEHKDSIEAMARYFTISACYPYGITLKLLGNGLESTFLEQVDYKRDKDDSSLVHVLGCPHKELLAFMEGKRFLKRERIVGEERCAVFVETKEETGETVYSFRDIYLAHATLNSIHLVDNSVFYSGMFLRPLHIVRRKSEHTNKDVLSYTFLFERSSYATVFALDSDRAMYHTLLKEDRVTVERFFHDEDEAIEALLQEGITLDTLNRYLHASPNVHQIGVSANIITSDGKTLFAQRGRSVSDGSGEKIKIYPGANGNAELISPDVDFYRYSVNEDLPTLSEHDVRIDFGGELSRETYAELHFMPKPMEWEYYGFCVVLQKACLEGEHIKHRRAHFNVMAKQRVDISFAEARSKAKLATESYEVSRLLGHEVRYYKTFLSHVFDWIGKAFAWLFSNRAFFTSLLSVSVFLAVTQSFSDKGGSALKTVTNFVSFAFSALTVIILLCRIIKAGSRWLRLKKQLKTTAICGNFEKKSEKLLREQNKDYHYSPMALTLLGLVIYESMPLRKNKKK